MDFWFTFVTFIVFMVSISIHELAHAFEMRKHGIHIKEISLLGLGKPVFTFKWKRFFGNVPIMIKIFPIGAYVSPADNAPKYMEKLTSNQRCSIYAVGPFSNFLYGSMIIFVCSICRHGVSGGLFSFVNIVLLVTVCISLALYYFSEYTHYIIAIIGFVLLGFFVYSVVFDFMTIATKNGAILSIASEMHKNNMQINNPVNSIDEISSGTKFLNACTIGGIYSILLGIMNALPIGMFDGSRIFGEYATLIKQKYSNTILIFKFFKILGGILFVFLVVTAIGGDLWLIIKKIITIF